MRKLTHCRQCATAALQVHRDKALDTSFNTYTKVSVLVYEVSVLVYEADANNRIFNMTQ